MKMQSFPHVVVLQDLNIDILRVRYEAWEGIEAVSFCSSEVRILSHRSEGYNTTETLPAVLRSWARTGEDSRAMNTLADNCGRMSGVTEFDYDESLLMMACKEHPDTMLDVDAATCFAGQRGVELGKPFTPPPWGWRKNTCSASGGEPCACERCVANDARNFMLSPSVFTHSESRAMSDGLVSRRTWAPGEDPSDSRSPIGEDQFDTFGESSKGVVLSSEKGAGESGLDNAPVPASRSRRISGIFRKVRSSASLSQVKSPLSYDI